MVGALTDKEVFVLPFARVSDLAGDHSFGGCGRGGIRWLDGDKEAYQENAKYKVKLIHALV